MTRSALFGSTIVHAITIWALFFYAFPGSMKVPPAAIQVALVNLPETVKGAPFARYSRSAKSLRAACRDDQFPRNRAMP